jgi:hypothetical protein
MTNTSSTSIRLTLRQFERGDGGSSFEFIWGVVVVAMMVMFIAAVTIIRPTQLPVWIAARECARNASATIDSARGVSQGQEAGSRSLIGNYLAGATPSVSVTRHDGIQGGLTTCVVNYTVTAVDNIPLVGGIFAASPARQVRAEVTMEIDPHKAFWKSQ